MKYFIMADPSVRVAQDFSRDFYRLSRPSDVADRSDVTTFLGTVFVHPSDGRVAVSIPENLLPVHVQADRFGLDPYTEDLILSERVETRNNITSSKGFRVKPETILPTRIASNLKTRAEMEADGWFSEIQQGV